MSLVGFIVEGLERMVKLAFMTGFPDQILIELHQFLDIETIPMEDLVTGARVLSLNKIQNPATHPNLGA